MGKKLRYGTTSVIDILLIAGILVLVNIYSVGSFKRVDLTENREYTISKATKKILSELDDIVNIKIFISDELPPEFTALDRQIRDMMDEFQAYANRNFRLKFIDPMKEPRYQQEAEMAGIQRVSFQVAKQDQLQIKEAYLGILIEHENKTESIPFIVDVANLEYDVMSRIMKVLQKENELPSIGILQGHGEPGTQQGNQQQGTPPGDMMLMVEVLREQYKAMDVKLDNRDKIPTTVDTLIVVNPGSIPDYQLWAIDQFVMGGGKLICFLNGIEGFDNLNEPPSSFNNGMQDILKFWGIKINNDFVLDKSCEQAQFRTGQFSFFRTVYPFWLKIKKENFDEYSTVTSSLESATFHWPSSIDLLKDRLEGIEITELVKSSDQSWLMTKDFSTNPRQDFNVLPTGDQYNLAVLLSGNFPSYFQDRDRPLKPDDGAEVGGDEPFKAQSTKTDIVVFSTGYLVNNQVWNPQGGSKANQNLLLNTIDYLSIGDALIGIRSRQSTSRPLKADMFDENKEKIFIRAVLLFAVPVLIILIGIVKFALKSGRKKRFEREYVKLQ